MCKCEDMEIERLENIFFIEVDDIEEIDMLVWV